MDAAGAQKSALVSKWSYEIDQYERRMKSWNDRCDKIAKRYADKRGGVTETNSKRFNAFWSNIQTQLPALYAKVPAPEIDRRFKDSDPVGRACSELLQRCASFALSSQDAHPLIHHAMLDYLLCARGVLWVRYQPTFREIEGAEPSLDDEDGPGEPSGALTDDESQAEPAQDLEFEEAAIDYVHRRDFGHTEARTWEELRAVWRRVFLDRDELVQRFGEDKGRRVPLNWTPEEDRAADAERDKKAVVYEVWDKTKKEVVWICKDFAEELDQRPDPLKLRKFFPCPKPLYATLTNDSLEPVPDFVLYQDQLNDLDELTARISMVTKSLKVAGCYDASAPALSRILNEGVENTLIPVDSWSVFAEKGGLKGTMELLPLQDIAAALLDMYQAREKVKQDMYEITGLSDLRRGASEAEETATAQELKGKFSEMRFAARRTDVHHFLRALIQIMVEIIAEHFDMQTLKRMSGLQMFDSVAEKQAAAAHFSGQGMAQAPGVLPQPVPQPDEAMQERLTSPTWEEVLAMLHDDALRTFRIDIETDSTVRADDDAEREAALSYAETIGKLISESGPLIKEAPQLGPLVGEMLLFVSRRFRIGRQLEGVLEKTIDDMKKAAANPPPPQPPIEVQKIMAQGKVDAQNIQLQGQVNSQYEAQKAQISAQVEMGKAQAKAASDQHQASLDAQVAQAQQAAQAAQNHDQNQLEAQRAAMDAHMQQQTELFKAHLAQQAAMQQQQFELLLKRMDSATKIEVAEIAAQTTLEAAQASAASAATE